jgi:DNA-binding response OmpR family regulator
MLVLIVEDDPGVARLLRVLVERAGHQAVLTGDGAAARGRLTDGPVPGLVILDRMLPDEDGVELLAWLRAAATTRDVPVLMLSAAVRTTVDRTANAPTLTLRKPFDLTDFDRALETLLSG